MMAIQAWDVQMQVPKICSQRSDIAADKESTIPNIINPSGSHWDYDTIARFPGQLSYGLSGFRKSKGRNPESV